MERPSWTRACLIASVAGAFVLAVRPAAQETPRADAEYVRLGYETFRAMARTSPYRGTAWQYVGPTNISGRATDVEVADRPGGRRIYVGYATSGVWKTDDDGASWRPIFDDYATSSIGDVAVAPSNHDVVWVGTGEANLFRASLPGVGIFKSTDAGRTFTHSGLTDSHTIARIVVHPANPDIVYVAASGHGWTENEMRGVFKTTDGGRTWTKVLYRGPSTGAIDLVMDPSKFDTLYAATWQRTRRKWSDPRVEPGHTESGLWKSTDGGRTWFEINQGLPAARFRGRLGIDIARSNPRVLYALLDNYEPGRPARDGERDAYGRPIFEARIKAAEIYRTADGGKSWRRISEHNEFMTNHSGTYGWVFGQIRVDPTDENRIYSLGLGLNVSSDAGRTFTELRGMHGDHHGLWIDPRKPSTLYNANDGGFYSSEDGGKSWKFAVSAGGAQFYNVTLDTGTPPWAYGSIQDHGSRRGRVDISAPDGLIPAQEWESAPGGEGTFHAIDPDDAAVVFSHGFYGNFTRTNQAEVAAATNGGRDERVQGRSGQDGSRRGVSAIRPSIGDGEPELRAQWLAPILTSLHEPGVVYAGYQFVYRSRDRGDSWERISPDLTSNDAGRMLLRSSSAIPFQTITALAESPIRKGLLYAGTDDGKLHVTRDQGKSWSELTAAVPSRKWYARVVPSAHAEGTVYVAQRGREDDDFAVYLYKSTDFGRTFTSIAGNIPAGCVNVVAEDRRSPDTLYAGTDFGVFISTNGGRVWHVLGSGLPSVQVSDLSYHAGGDVIVISTYGRGVWALKGSGAPVHRMSP